MFSRGIHTARSRYSLFLSLLAISFLSVTHAQEWREITATAAFSPRISHAAVVFDSKMWIMGGFDGSPRNDVWSSSDGETWSRATVSAAWSPRYGHEALQFQGKIFVMGGFDNVTAYNDVYSSTDGVNWLSVTNSAAWSPRILFGAEVFDGRMWISGGSDNAEVWSSLDGAAWTRVRAIAPFGERPGQRLVAFNNKLWMLGGITKGVGPLNDIWSSEDGVTWILEAGSTAWAGRAIPAVVNLNGQFWFMGGHHFNNNVYTTMGDVWTSNNMTSWAPQPDPPWGPRDDFRALAFDGKLWVISGSGPTGRRSDVWSYGQQNILGCNCSKSTTPNLADFLTFLSSLGVLFATRSRFR